MDLQQVSWRGAAVWIEAEPPGDAFITGADSAGHSVLREAAFQILVEEEGQPLLKGHRPIPLVVYQERRGGDCVDRKEWGVGGIVIGMSKMTAKMWISKCTLSGLPVILSFLAMTCYLS